MIFETLRSVKGKLIKGRVRDMLEEHTIATWVAIVCIAIKTDGHHMVPCRRYGAVDT